MIIKKAHYAALAVLIFVLVACGVPERTEPTVAPPVPTVARTPEPATPATASEPTAAPIATEIATTAPAAEAAQLSFTPATYTDESAGFALDYPADWTLDPSSQTGVRGGQALLLSPGTTLETLTDGGSRVSITTYIWDPKNDLDAYVAQRKVAWDASGFAITSEEAWQLVDGRTAYVFTVNMPSEPTFTLFTTVGEDYLQIIGDGDQALVAEIARTLRPLN